MVLATLATALYLASSLLLARGLAAQQRERMPAALWLAAIAVALHATLHLLAWRTTGSVDLRFFATLSLVGGAVAGLTTLLALQRPVLALGVPVFPVAAATALLYVAAEPAGAATPQDWQIQLHAWLALTAYATLSLAALLAIMLWLQDRALRRRQLATALRAFPPLTLVEGLLFRLIGAGFALLTLALLSGAVFVQNLFAQHLVHKTVLSLLAWAVFGALLFGRLRYGWRGRRAVRLTLVAMALLGLAFFGSRFVLELVLQRNV